MFQTVREFRKVLDSDPNGIEWKSIGLQDVYLTDQVMFGWLAPQYKNGALVGMTQVLPWFGCRGYLSEAYAGALLGKGMYYSGKHWTKAAHIHKHPMLLILNSAMSENKMKSTIVLINRLEEAVGWEKSTYYSIQQNGKYSGTYTRIVFVGSKRWTRSTFYISLICFLLRCAAKEPYKVEETTEEYFMRLANSGSIRALDKTAWLKIVTVDVKSIEWVMAYQDRILGADHHHYSRKAIEKAGQKRTHSTGIRFLIAVSYLIRKRQPVDGMNIRNNPEAKKKMQELATYYPRVRISQRFIWNFAEILVEKTEVNTNYSAAI